MLLDDFGPFLWTKTISFTWALTVTGVAFFIMRRVLMRVGLYDVMERLHDRAQNGETQAYLPVAIAHAAAIMIWMLCAAILGGVDH